MERIHFIIAIIIVILIIINTPSITNDSKQGLNDLSPFNDQFREYLWKNNKLSMYTSILGIPSNWRLDPKNPVHVKTLSRIQEHIRYLVGDSFARLANRNFAYNAQRGRVRINDTDRKKAFDREYNKIVNDPNYKFDGTITRG